MVDYNNYAKKFAQSRKNMKWAELEYFFSLIGKDESILDLACGSGRLLEQYKNYFGDFPEKYLGVDISDGLIGEARTLYLKQEFQIGDMREISGISGLEKYESIFCIAGFHHLESLEERKQALIEMCKALKKGGKIYMTNWSLHIGENFEKYLKSQIQGSKNIYNSWDYSIKIGEYMRYYHSFSLEELEYLTQEAGLRIKENRIFDTGRNSITILEK